MSKAPTLFDFDDFFPEAEGPEKPAAKEKAVKASPKKKQDESAAAEAKIPSEESETESNDETESLPTEEEGLSGEQPLSGSVSSIEAQYVKPSLELPGKRALEEAMSRDIPIDLDRQLNEELAAAIPFAESKYPFDPGSVEVIEKEKKQSREAVFPPEAEPTDETVAPVHPLPEWSLDKNYYSIGEVAHLFGVNISHIRFWTTEFKMKPRTTRKGDRLYTPDQIAELRLIYHLVKEKKHTLKGAMEILKSRKGTVASHLDLRESLIQLRDTLAEVRESL